MLKSFLTTAGAAAELGVNASRVRQLILSGRLKATKIGRDWAVEVDEINRFKQDDRDRRRKGDE